mgnify:CR=1 FL=1
MLERDFQKNLIQELKERFPACVVMQNASSYIQEIPDLTVLYRDRCVVPELKPASGSSRRPNQSFYVEKLNEMSYAAYIHPGNKEQVLDEVQRSFKTCR